MAVSKTELRALELGYLPSRPIFDNRYDLVLDGPSGLKRIQVKYADGKSSHSEGSVSVKLDYETRKKKYITYQPSEVDALIVYLPRVDKLCYLPLSVFQGKRRLSIRIEKCKNNQKMGIIDAKNYYW